MLIDRLLDDAADDSEYNQRLAREESEIRSTMIPINLRQNRQWPRTRCRRQMKTAFSRAKYQQRW